MQTGLTGKVVTGATATTWDISCEPVHAAVYTPPDSPDMARIQRGRIAMGDDMNRQLAPRSGRTRGRAGSTRSR